VCCDNLVSPGPHGEREYQSDCCPGVFYDAAAAAETIVYTLLLSTRKYIIHSYRIYICAVEVTSCVWREREE